MVEGPGEDIGGNAAQLQKKTQHLGDSSTMGWPPRTAAMVECSQMEPRQSVCAAKGRAGEMTEAPGRSPQLKKVQIIFWIFKSLGILKGLNL